MGPMETRGTLEGRPRPVVCKRLSRWVTVEELVKGMAWGQVSGEAKRAARELAEASGITLRYAVAMVM